MNQLADPPQSVLSHLSELRLRLLMAFGGILVAVLVLLPFSRELYALISMPLRAVLPEGAGMIATDVASPVLAPLRITVFFALVCAMPWVCFQLWLFVSPALYRREKWLSIVLLPLAIALFYAGMLFCWFAVFPLLFEFFTGFAPEGVTVMTDIARYLDFVLRFALIFGLVFETPAVLLALVAAGFISRKTLAHARPYVMLGCLTLGMLLTPPDVISQLLLAVPVWLLYELTLLLLYLFRIGGSGARPEVPEE